jgi:regulatory protein
MRITNVATTQHDAERVSIFVDDHFALACHALVWLTSGLRIDGEVTEADLARLRQAEDLRALKDRALGLLAGRPRGRSDLQRRLQHGTKAHPTPTPEQVRQVIDELAQQGLIDDQAFAAFWVEQRDRFRPKGSLALRAELAQQGVARADAETALAPERDLERAIAAGRKQAERLAQQPAMNPRAFRDRLGPFLQRRGFSYATAREAIATLWGELAPRTQDDMGDAFDEETEQ